MLFVGDFSREVLVVLTLVEVLGAASGDHLGKESALVCPVSPLLQVVTVVEILAFKLLLHFIIGI